MCRPLWRYSSSNPDFAAVEERTAAACRSEAVAPRAEHHHSGFNFAPEVILCSVRLASCKQIVYIKTIRSFADSETEQFFNTGRSRRLPQSIQRRAARKLQLLDDATGLEDLRLPPSNRLEVLRGDRAGQHSIRINDQWRVCFHFLDGDAFEVEIVDYHP
jgi:toxin HigB-1